MSDPYRIFGSELSPYSVKVRSYFRYKGIAHDWIVRSQDNMEEFKRHARLPLIPLVLTPEGTALQDSTPILEKIEELHPEPAIHPRDPDLAFLSALIEEYADEWVNKPMFHYRWTYEADQKAASQRLARDNLPHASGSERAQLAQAIRARMRPRLAFVGSSAATCAQIEQSYQRLLEILEAHLAPRPYLFGARPAFADFGLAAQIHECTVDPTPRAWMESHAPGVKLWAKRMLDPKNEGPFEDWPRLEPTLFPLLADEVGSVFLPWSDANSRALERGDAEFSVSLSGKPFTQNTQKYHARSLAVLRARYAALAERSRLDPILERAGCLQTLQA